MNQEVMNLPQPSVTHEKIVTSISTAGTPA